MVFDKTNYICKVIFLLAISFHFFTEFFTFIVFPGEIYDNTITINQTGESYYPVNIYVSVSEANRDLYRSILVTLLSSCMTLITLHVYMNDEIEVGEKVICEI